MADNDVVGHDPTCVEHAGVVNDAAAIKALERKAKKKAEKEAKLAKLKEKEAKQAIEKANRDAREMSGEIKAKKVKAEVPKVVDNTPCGEKKIFEGVMPAAYDPGYVESAWYAWWKKEGFFKPENHTTGTVTLDNPKGKFVMPMPPPNVTGSLHLGHALTNAIEDLLTRYHRMNGKTVLWNPGCDHAGIATQVVTEKKIWREQKKTRHDLGRDAFIDEIWKWKNEKGHRIYEQLERLGSSMDWDRARFTMDPSMNKAVIEAFVRLYSKGLIYRSNRLVNWSVSLRSAISDIEVDYIELEGSKMLKVPGHDGKKYEFGVLIDFAYKVEGSDEEIVVATTRIETMLGDTGVAVHPEDPRYAHLLGKFCVHPFLPERRIPIVADTYVDRDFGTGAVKITPAHDFNDYEVGKRCQLDIVNILNDDGTMNEVCGQFTGMKRYDARNAIIKSLEKHGLLRGKRENPMKVPICSRSKDVLEPLIKMQWYVDCDDMARRSMEAVENKDLVLVPSLHEKTWNYWLGNTRPWCISRQLWWGHRIPAYQVKIAGRPNPDVTDTNAWIVGRTQEEAMANAVEKFGVPSTDITLEQDPDVLDTWFSSALFPFSIFGWPDKTPDFEKFFPNTLLETGHDILFFWVARMVMFSLELHDKLPFTTVYLHSLVRDCHGRKMSKSLGNVVDPLDVITGITLEKLHLTLENGNLDEKEIKNARLGQATDYPNGIPECGADALRFALCSFAAIGRDINLDVERVQGYRFFCNKMWNAFKFATMKFPSGFVAPASFELRGDESRMDLWILSRLSNAVTSANAAFPIYDFPAVTTAIYSFWLYEFCDVYLEAIKCLFDKDSSVQAQAATCATLYTVLDVSLRLCAPLMPFLTEELWQRLTRRSGEQAPTIHLSSYPTPEETHWRDETLEANVTDVLKIVRLVRRHKETFLPGRKACPNVYVVSNDALIKRMQPFTDVICSLSTPNTTLLADVAAVPEGCAVSGEGEISTFVAVKGHVDPKEELTKLRKEKESLDKKLTDLVAKMSAPTFAKVRELGKETMREQRSAAEIRLENVVVAMDMYNSWV